MRHPTRAAIDKFNRIFGIEPHPHSQDWEIEYSDPDRLDEFLEAYDTQTENDDEKFTLMALILGSYEEWHFEERLVSDYWEAIKSRILGDYALLKDHVFYYACLDEEDVEDCFPITPQMREVIEEIEKGKLIKMVPSSGFTFNDYAIEVTSPDDNEKDYQAVMESRDYLRLWSDSEWPEDHFSKAENLEDLKAHREEHERREAFGYNIHSIQKDRCFGSIYLNEVDFIAENYCREDTLKNEVALFDAVVVYWTSKEFRERGHLDEFCKALVHWLEKDWNLEKWLLLMRKNIAVDGKLLEKNGLVQWKTLENTKGQVIHLYKKE